MVEPFIDQKKNKWALKYITLTKLKNKKTIPFTVASIRILRNKLHQEGERKTYTLETTKLS